ncbi:MAG: hypothetical protein ABJD97_04505 [Betaproteobacteria bacterium]
MNSSHAIAHLDHRSAQLIDLGPDIERVVKTGQHAHATRQHGSEVRSEHEFFASVCDLIDGFAKVLVTGGHTPLADFRHYVAKHRPLTAPRIAGYDVVDHPTDKQLVALGRRRLDELERLAADATGH